MRAPGDRLHGRLVVRVLQNGLLRVHVPDVELVVVAAASQLLVVVAPLHATDLLLVPH